jgi:hypothetical protein
LEEKPSIDDIIDAWDLDCSEVMVSARGSTYRAIPRIDRRTHFLNLIQSILDNGYEEDDLKTGSLSTKIVMLCWPEVNRKCTMSELKKWKDDTRRTWEDAIKEKIGTNVVLSKHVEGKIPIPFVAKRAPEKIIEINPSDRIKMNTEDMLENPLDLDFLKELDSNE